MIAAAAFLTLPIQAVAQKTPTIDDQSWRCELSGSGMDRGKLIDFADRSILIELTRPNSREVSYRVTDLHEPSGPGLKGSDLLDKLLNCGPAPCLISFSNETSIVLSLEPGDKPTSWHAAIERSANLFGGGYHDGTKLYFENWTGRCLKAS